MSFIRRFAGIVVRRVPGAHRAASLRNFDAKFRNFFDARFDTVNSQLVQNQLETNDRLADVESQIHAIENRINDINTTMQILARAMQQQKEIISELRATLLGSEKGNA